MVSTKLATPKPQIDMAEGKVSIIKVIKAIFKKKKNEKRDDKQKDEERHKDEKAVETAESIAVYTQKRILQLYNEKKERSELNKTLGVIKTEEVPEKSEFEDLIKNDGSTDKIDRSRTDSGYSDKADTEDEKEINNDFNDDEAVLIGIDKLRIDDKDLIDEEKKVSSKDDDKKEVLAVDNANELDSSKKEVLTKNDSDTEDVVENLEKLSISDGKKKKNTFIVTVSRAPIRHKTDLGKNIAPYSLSSGDSQSQTQVNTFLLSGSQVIVNQNKTADLAEFDNAQQQLQMVSQFCLQENNDDYFNMVDELINEQSDLQIQDLIPKDRKELDAIISEMNAELCQQVLPNINAEIYSNVSHDVQAPEMSQQITEDRYPEYYGSMNACFLTPPYSDNASSPISHSSYTHSPGLSNVLSPPSSEYPDGQSSFSPQSASLSPFYSNLSPETYVSQEFPAERPERLSPVFSNDSQVESEYPVFLETKSKERKSSISSMKMVAYRHLQKDIAQSFTKKECCVSSRKSCKEIFQGYLERLSLHQRNSLVLKVSGMDLRYAYGTLRKQLCNISQNIHEDVSFSIFYSICDRVANKDPAQLVGEFGLNLLKSAALTCPHRPVLTRLLVHCISSAIKQHPTLVEGRNTVFHEVDALGDTLLTACVRQGDTCADVLAELCAQCTVADGAQVPLFRVGHLNGDGLSALHVACAEHCPTVPRLHCVHVLLQHAGADVRQKDAKAGDTALHLAVNARHCDLKMILLLFHLDRKEWYELAHIKNTSQSTPMDYARMATKSRTRDGYPPEVLEFFKKCRANPGKSKNSDS